jgi:formate-dependent nitrite reductase membrane component NrfD
MNPFAEIVEVAPLLEAIWTSAAFGLGVLVIAGIGVTASLRAADDRGEHNQGGFAGMSIVTIACALALVAAVVLGIWAMTQ